MFKIVSQKGIKQQRKPHHDGISAPETKKASASIDWTEYPEECTTKL
jgi:hypothetical protein